MSEKTDDPALDPHNPLVSDREFFDLMNCEFASGGDSKDHEQKNRVWRRIESSLQRFRQRRVEKKPRSYFSINWFIPATVVALLSLFILPITFLDPPKEEIFTPKGEEEFIQAQLSLQTTGITGLIFKEAAEIKIGDKIVFQIDSSQSGFMQLVKLEGASGPEELSGILRVEAGEPKTVADDEGAIGLEVESFDSGTYCVLVGTDKEALAALLMTESWLAAAIDGGNCLTLNVEPRN